MNNIENLIIAYRLNQTDENFRSIYLQITKSVIGLEDGNPYFKKIAKSMKADAHDVKAVFDDAVIESLSKYTIGRNFLHYFKNMWKRRRTDLYRKVKRVRHNEVYDDMHIDEEIEEGFTQIPDPLKVEDAVLKTKKADQRQLIDFMVRGENERTTAIVQAYLTTEFKTPTAIGNHLGLDHKQVSRAVTRLASKFDTKQFGDYHDYLVAL